MLTAETQPYEILVRFNPDGSIKGAHRKHLRVINDGDQMISASEIIAPFELPTAVATKLKNLMAEAATQDT